MMKMSYFPGGSPPAPAGLGASPWGGGGGGALIFRCAQKTASSEAGEPRDQVGGVALAAGRSYKSAGSRRSRFVKEEKSRGISKRPWRSREVVNCNNPCQHQAGRKERNWL